MIQECLKKRQIKYRAKDAGSFGRKAAIPSELSPEKPKYGDPLYEITDLAGVRVITHFPGTLVDIDRLLSDEFDILERSDKGVELIEDEDLVGSRTFGRVRKIHKRGRGGSSAHDPAARLGRDRT